MGGALCRCRGSPAAVEVGSQALPQGAQARHESIQLLEVRSGKLSEAPGPERSQADTDQAGVMDIGYPANQTRRLSPVHQSDSAVMALRLVGLVVPRALGVGYDAISDVLLGRIAAGALAALLVAKLPAWWVALASGTSGGTLAPLLLIGGAFGSLFGSAVQVVLPGATVSPGAFALVAIAGPWPTAGAGTATAGLAIRGRSDP